MDRVPFSPFFIRTLRRAILISKAGARIITNEYQNLRHAKEHIK